MIRGKNIILRALEPADAAPYHRFINDEESNFTRGLFLPTSTVEAESYIANEAKSCAERLTLAIELEYSTFIGLIGLRNICSRSRRAELWIYIGDKDNTKKGYGSDAIRTICNYGFDSMNLNRIWLECDPGYPKIMNAYQKVGFVLEGTLRQSYYRRGEYRDTCIMGLLRESWEKHSKTGISS